MLYEWALIVLVYYGRHPAVVEMKTEAACIAAARSVIDRESGAARAYCVNRETGAVYMERRP